MRLTDERVHFFGELKKDCRKTYAGNLVCFRKGGQAGEFDGQIGSLHEKAD
jgi:hypothetical protein